MQNLTKMKVSVITVCFNSASTIEATLRSVNKQTWPDVEHIIIDGGSSDKTLEIVSSYGDRVSYVVSEPDKGIYDAMNKGVRAAGGHIIYFLNSDDQLCDSHVIEDVVKYFCKNPESRLVYGDVIYRDGNRNWLCRFEHITKKNIIHEHLCHQAVFAHRDLFYTVGLFDLQYPINADYDWLLRVFYSGVQTRYVNRKIAIFDATGRHMDDIHRLRSERRKVRIKHMGPVRYSVGDLAYRFRRKCKGMMGIKK